MNRTPTARACFREQQPPPVFPPVIHVEGTRPLMRWSRQAGAWARAIRAATRPRPEVEVHRVDAGGAENVRPEIGRRGDAEGAEKGG